MPKLNLFFYGLLCFMAACTGIDTPDVDPKDIIALEVLDENGDALTENPLADGKTILILRATIPSNADDNFKDITFTTSDGTFIGSGNQTIKERVNVNGVAEVRLTVPFSTEETQLFFTSTTGTYDDDASISLQRIEEVLSVELLSENLQPLVEPVLADNQQTVVVKGKVLTNFSVLNTITFKTSGGLFSNGKNEVTVKTDLENEAITRLQVHQSIDSIFVTAEVGDGPVSTREEVIQMKRALPDTLFIEPEKLIMGQNETNEIVVFLERFPDRGLVTIGTEVAFDAFQLDSNNMQVTVGRFTGINEAKSDANQKVSTTFRTDTQNVDSAQAIIIRISSMNDQSKPIPKEISIKVD